MQTVVLHRAGLPVIDTRVYGHYDQAWENEKSLPFIMKTMAGSHGSGVKKIVSQRGIKYFSGVYAPWKVLFQPFLTTGQDYRVIVIGKKVLGVMRRIAQEGEYLTNVSAGGKYEEAEITPELESLALRTADAFQAEYGGADIMYDQSGKPYVLEFNKAAEFRGFEACTGLNVAGEIVKYLVGKQ
jgi:ribosomal protein S6--L-glutamate ligase